VFRRGVGPSEGVGRTENARSRILTVVYRHPGFRLSIHTGTPTSVLLVTRSQPAVTVEMEREAMSHFFDLTDATDVTIVSVPPRRREIPFV
jgi:hypothetical protein